MSASGGRDTGIDNPQPGDVLAGKYRVESVLGKGGMGVVVAATHVQLGQRVAIKYLLRPDVTDIVSRFLREARAAVRLRSEHVARVLDVGEFENGAPYMVMEYLEGGDLSRHLKTHGPLPVHEAIDYLLQTCEAIAEAHSAGIVHRDLKPANLFLMKTPDGSLSVKVLDFGISKVSENEQGGDGMQLTKTEMVLGSPLYMSPEQLKSSKDVDARSDIWALGVILYQLLVGKVPFNADTFSGLILKVNLDAATPISEIRSDVPKGLEDAVFRCLEKKRDDRFQNIGEFALSIAEFGSPTARISAEKARRVLETAGIKVELPQPREQSVISGELAAAASTGGASATSAGAIKPDTQASTKTSVMSKSTAEPEATSASVAEPPKRGRAPLAIAIAAVGLLGIAGFFLVSKKNAAELPSTSASVTNATNASSAAAPAPSPEVKPVVDAKTAEAALQAASAAPSASAAAALSASAKGAGAAPGTKSPSTDKPPPTSTTSTTTATTTTKKPNNPLSGVGIE